MGHAKKFSVDPSWKVLITDLGLTTEEVLKHAKLPVDLFSRKDARLDVNQYFSLWLALEKRINDESFPVKFAESMKAETFSPPIFASLCSPDLNTAVSRLSYYKQLIGPMKLDINIGKEYTTLELDCLYFNDPLPQSLIATEILFFVNLARMGTRENVTPVSVTSTSPLHDNNRYTEYLGIKPQKGEVNEVIFSAEDASKPFITENAGMWEFFEPELRRRLADVKKDASFSTRVQSSLHEMLPSGICSIEDVAKKMAISKRTLQRNLSNENTTFQNELNRTREKLALHYLKKSELPVSEISFLIGFDDPNSFARAFRTWTGKTPGVVRQELSGSLNFY